MSQQREVRYAAAQAFHESLKQLQQRLEVADNEPTKRSLKTARNQSFQSSNPPDVAFDLESFEAAIADIEQFIQARDPNSHSSGHSL